MKILLCDAGQEFDLDQITPIGGSEMTALLLAKGLSELGHQIVILSSNKKTPQRKNNLILDFIGNFDGYAPISDVIILNRFIPPTSNRYKNVFILSHDNFDQKNVGWMINPQVVNFFKSIICVSEYQKNAFNKYFNISLDKMSILGNPIDISNYMGYSKRNLNKLIFASIPYKGIDVLKDIFDNVCIKSKRDDLELHIFSSMKLYGRDQEDTQYEKAFSELQNTKGIFLHNPVGMQDLAKEFLSSSLLLMPSTYAETFGRVSVEAQCAGCIPIAVDNGANSEVMQDGITGFLTKGKNIYNKQTFNEFVDLICNSLEKDLYSNRLKAQNLAKNYNYTKLSRKLLNIISEAINV